jgi:hypothetical protein
LVLEAARMWCGARWWRTSKALASPDDLRAALGAEHEDDMVGDDPRRMRATTRVA